MSRCVFAIVALATIVPIGVSAQSTEQKPAPPPPEVNSVINVTKPGAEVALKHVLKVQIANFQAWRDKNPQTELHLFLAGAELKNVVALPTSIEASKDQASKDAGLLAFRLTPEVDDKDDNTRKTWVQVLQAAKSGPIDISVGPAGQAPFKSAAKIQLDVYPTVLTYSVIGVYLVIAFLIFWLGRSSFMLRDSNGAPNPPYSLARHQMAAWFIVVVGAYLYIWVTTGLFSWVSTTALTLMGISGATGLVAVGMDASKRTDAANARAALQAERDALDRTLNDAATGLQAQLQAAAAGSPQAVELTAAITPKLARLNELNTLLNAPAPQPQNSIGWLKDLLSDDHGISFHRVQMAVWTVVLVLVFIIAVKTNVLMPDFDTTLLGLMGISSGTYLGFKFPETPA